MTIKSVHRYQTSDGKEHTSMVAAQRHEAAFKVMSGIKTILDKAAIANGYGSAHIDLVNKPELTIALRDMCNKALNYHRNYTGKVKGATKGAKKNV